jgi:carbohydrate kinase (thermoresistant glucokinase family)
LDALVEATAIHYAKSVPQRRSSADPVQVFGLLGLSDFEYLITLLAISRLGHTTLLLSTRITEEAHISLLQNTRATSIITSSSFAALGKKVALRAGVRQLSMASLLDVNVPEVSKARLPAAGLHGPTENNHCAWIIHSSGSTGLPKPIYQTHSCALRNFANNFGLRGYITLPLFHGHGISCLFRAMYSSKLIYMYNASLPLTAPTLLNTLNDHEDIQILYAVPYALKLLSETDESLKRLARLELVMFGGSACAKPIGDALVQNGVRLVSHYGATEVGQLMTSFRARSDPDWDYVRAGPNLLPYIRWEEQPGMPGIYELCVLDGWPSKVASNRPDGSYATKDLFQKHPTTPNAWRYYARSDDTLVLENGEKANPLVIEGVARKNSNVAEAIAFGSTKPRVGLFVIPSEKCQFKTDQELIDVIFPDIEACNAQLPAYAYVSRDMIFVLPKDTEYRRTDKGTLIRHAFYKDFADKINEVYDAQEGTGDRHLEGEELIRFLKESLMEVVPFLDSSDIGATTDIFSLGIDSLHSMRLRTALMGTLDLGGQKLVQNFIFENPSLQAMADEITILRRGNAPKKQATVEERMQCLIDKYSTGFKTHVQVPRDVDGQIVVLTGATGSLGAHIAVKLAQLDQVRKVYCLVRAKSLESARRRVAQSLRQRMVAFNLSPAAGRKIIALPSDLSNSVSLGLEEDTFSQLKRSVTAVIHCAWSVNFNWSLESFEKSCIAATRNLLDLCLSVEGPKPASFVFCSSVSTVSCTPGNWAREALPESLSCAHNIGYAQSKLVTEHIVVRAGQQTGMACRVLRSGQIVADSTHGIWNATEAIPMILQCAKTIKALPQLDDILSWTPVDVMAASFVELSLAPVVESPVLNVTNATLNQWTQDLLPLLREAGLEFEELSKQAWLRRLRESDQDPEANPPVKLLEFFTQKYDNNNPSRTLLYETKSARAASPSLANARGLNSSFTSRFVKYFISQCWIEESASLLQHREVIFLIGPCGSGKSTAAQALSSLLNIPTVEGDALHSPSACQKMVNNLPLEDSDRCEWLAHIRGAVMDRLLNSSTPAVAVTCSALRTAYRDELRRLGQLLNFPITVTFLLLSIQDEAHLKMRMAKRRAAGLSYMKCLMVDSQLELLEEPVDENDVILIDSSQEKENVLDIVVETVQSQILNA